MGMLFPSRSLLKILVIMKLAIFIILFTAFQVSAMDLNGQTVSLNVKQTEIRKILNSIERSGQYRFLYNYELKALKTELTLMSLTFQLLLPSTNCLKAIILPINY